MSANLVEIFSSVQGEGPDVGASTIFIRFGGCDLRCRWCDSAHTWRPAERCRVETSRGTGSSRLLPNPLEVADIVAAAEGLELSAHRFVSLTGGEPLLQPESVGAVARALRGRGPRILLETHGLRVAPLESCIHVLDVVSMDWKLSSDVRRESDAARGEVRAFHDEHARFLEIACRAPEVVVKIVVTPNSEDAEIDAALERIARIHPAVCLVLQPVTPCGSVKERPVAERVLELARRAEGRLADVRVIPQTHPLYGAP